jgi:hypothetical protein
MQIVIQTQSGTYIVPSEAEGALVAWLQQNAVKAGQSPVREQNDDQNYAGRQLISETFKGEF